MLQQSGNNVNADPFRASQDRSEINAIFVHSELDDAGLSPEEFRIYCHLARRAGQNGDAYPGIRGMAKLCRMRNSTVISAIKRLEELCMIVAERKPGETTHYRLTKHSFWKMRCTNPANGGVPNGATVCTNPANGGVPNGATKGNPSKVIHLSKSTEGGKSRMTKEEIARTDDVMAEIKWRVNVLMNHKPDFAWQPQNEHPLYDVALRPEALEELADIETLYRNPGGHKDRLSTTARTLLTNWTDNLDRAHNPKPIYEPTKRQLTAPSRNEGTFNDGAPGKYAARQARINARLDQAGTKPVQRPGTGSP